MEKTWCLISPKGARQLDDREFLKHVRGQITMIVRWADTLLTPYWQSKGYDKARIETFEAMKRLRQFLLHMIDEAIRVANAAVAHDLRLELARLDEWDGNPVPQAERMVGQSKRRAADGSREGDDSSNGCKARGGA